MRNRSQHGVTLIEMVIVVALIGLMAGITFPAVSSGIDSLRLAGGSDDIVSFINGAVNRSQRLQEVVEIEISMDRNSLSMRSSRPGFDRDLALPAGVKIERVIPPLPVGEVRVRQFLLFPGGTVPRFGVILANRRGARRLVRVDPITGVAQIERLANQ